MPYQQRRKLLELNKKISSNTGGSNGCTFRPKINEVSKKITKRHSSDENNGMG